MRHFIPVALDTYFRGNSHELEFCRKIQAGGNQLVAATATGQRLGEGCELKLRKQELADVLTEYGQLARDRRTSPLEDSATATPPPRQVPQPPPGGLILRGYCTYLDTRADGKLARSREFYYKENPDRWAAETQSDMLWLTAAEWQSLVPADPRQGERSEVAETIQQRFFSTIGIDYMEGSVDSLPTRQTSLTLTVQRVTPEAILLQLDGHGQMGKPLDETLRGEARSRGCEVRVLGYVNYDRRKQAVDRFDLIGVGRAWGNKMEYVRREVRLDRYPWMYGIACELVTGESAIDRIPPYNLLHYGAAGPYFPDR